MITKEMKKLIEDNALALATVDDKGNPHNIALGYVKVVSKDKLLVTVDFVVQTIKYIKKNPNVAIAVWNKEWKKKCIGYELKGNAKYFSKGKWAEFVKKMPENKGLKCRGAILVRINKIKRLA
jgi:predicted pyridoxine 5'-phosphate oxidase superfamily flavin-nucleotide-binding protein